LVCAVSPLIRRCVSREKYLLLREDADAIEKVLVRSRLPQRALESRRKLPFFRQRTEEARVDDRVHDVRRLRQTVGKPRRGAEHEPDQRDQVGILPQQRKQPSAAVQSGEKPVERNDRRVRIRRAGKMLEQ
jgi:hypothetical protein